MMWKVTVCCWQEIPSNFLVAERWSHCSKTQNETEHWSFARYFRRRSYPENLHLFLHVLRGRGFFSSSKKRLRSGHEIALRGKFPGGSYHEQKGTFVVCNRRFLSWTNVNSTRRRQILFILVFRNISVAILRLWCKKILIESIFYLIMINFV